MLGSRIVLSQKTVRTTFLVVHLFGSAKTVWSACVMGKQGPPLAWAIFIDIPCWKNTQLCSPEQSSYAPQKLRVDYKNTWSLFIY